MVEHLDQLLNSHRFQLLLGKLTFIFKVAYVTDSKNIPTITAFQVATILVAMAPKISGASDLICKIVSLNQTSWLPNGDQAKTLT